MRRKPFKRGKRGEAGRFVQLPEWVQASAAWATLKPGPRALYVELKRQYNGHNNGQIFLSHRDAASALNAHRNSVGAWFKELEIRGFIRMTQGSHLGPSGVGQTAHWALEEVQCDDRTPAGKAFMRWGQKQNPRTNNVTPRHNDCDASGLNAAFSGETVTKNVT